MSIGTELTSGETRDTNAGELARSLTGAGVEVARLAALPDRRGVVEEAFRAALRRVDLVVTTGGLGPTPDDLTRESIAAVCAEVPTVDPVLEAWLRGLWDRRGLPFAEMNLKQAWLIPSARPLANPNGTAPGWWVDRPDGRVIVTLPGPPREMRPMWRDEALPRLRERGLGTRPGGPHLAPDRDRRVGRRRPPRRGPPPGAQPRGRDLRPARRRRRPPFGGRPAGCLGRPGPDRRGASRRDRAARPRRRRRARLGPWRDDLGRGDRDRARSTRLVAGHPGVGHGRGPRDAARRGALARCGASRSPPPRRDGRSTDVAGAAAEVRATAESDVGLAVAIRPRGSDTAVSVAVVTPTRTRPATEHGLPGRRSRSDAGRGHRSRAAPRDAPPRWPPDDPERSSSGGRSARARAGRR